MCWTEVEERLRFRWHGPGLLWIWSIINVKWLFRGKFLRHDPTSVVDVVGNFDRCNDRLL